MDEQKQPWELTVMEACQNTALWEQVDKGEVAVRFKYARSSGCITRVFRNRGDWQYSYTLAGWRRAVFHAGGKAKLIVEPL